MKNKEEVAILIPTFNNQQFLEPCLRSLINTNTAFLYHIYVINNGHPNSCDFISPKLRRLTVLQTGGKNLGWEGGLKFAYEKTKSKFVMFMNDDTYVPQSSAFWMQNLLASFEDPKVGAVAPTTNVVMGSQNIFIPLTVGKIETNLLIGFCVLFKREALDKAGGIDDTLPGGDDLDYSIRLRKVGYKLICDRRVFVYHHGFQTGIRIKGEPTKVDGWNSYEMKEKTDTALIKKHGFREWYECLYAPYKVYETHPSEDLEGNLIRKLVNPQATILELGCGGKKTIKKAIGVDLYKKGDRIPSLGETISVADVKADVSKELPFKDESFDFIIGRHILEHILDPIFAIKLWVSKLKKGGKLILALPDQNQIDSIVMNREHLHAYTPTTMKSLIGALGYKVLNTIDVKNKISFVIIITK